MREHRCCDGIQSTSTRIASRVWCHVYFLSVGAFAPGVFHVAELYFNSACRGPWHSILCSAKGRVASYSSGIVGVQQFSATVNSTTSCRAQAQCSVTR